MADAGRTGLVDLEKELTCSICTDLLYQPLTLLDCLHTFCGACLKEWFQFQASTATSIHPYTCPSCRASVRTTQPNATVTTLLDMFIQANPGRGKSEEDKKVDREKYRSGDNVMPKLRRREDPGAEEERRILEEVQQLSLSEVGIPSGSANLEPPQDRRRRERSRDASRGSRDSRQREGRSRSRNPPEPTSSSSRDAVPARQVEHQSSLRSLLSSSELDSQEMEEEIMRQIMEEGLLDGIDLNNIDVTQEDEISERIAQAYRRRQTERQRQRRERRERLAREGRPESSSGSGTPQELRSPAIRDEESRRRAQGRSSDSGTSTPQGPNSRPPVSRPGLIDAANRGHHGHHRRSSSQGSTRSARRADRPASLSVTSARQSASSATDLGERPSTSASTVSPSRRRSENQSRATVEERQQFRNGLHAPSSSNPNSPRRAVFNIPTTESPPASTSIVGTPLSSPLASTVAVITPSTARRTTDPTSVRQPRSTSASTPPILSPAIFSRAVAELPVGGARSRASSMTAAAPMLYSEPSITCKQCGKEHIEYDVHYNCSHCDDGDYDICPRCYYTGKGCKHWYGFGWVAWPRYEQQAPPGGYPPNHEHPHILVGHRYRRPTTPLKESSTPPHTLMSEDDPAHRMEFGVFCDICKAHANGCYWKCDMCNEGAWGFCNDCVNQGRHCTHPLLPVAHKPNEATEPVADANTPDLLSQPESSSRAASVSPSLAPPPIHPETSPPLTPKSASLLRGPGLITIANTIFRPLTFTTRCDICDYPIPPSYTRYHCLKCNKGDYDICMSCYHKLVVSNRISKEDGANGWRRCPRGHRMVIVGFEDRDGGQRRVVVKELVGGWALRDDDANTAPRSPTSTSTPANVSLNPPAVRKDSLSPPSVRRISQSPTRTTSPTSILHTTPLPLRFPPDGGVGLRIQARWTYLPDEGDTDELAFPRLAEITEAEDVNGDWFWGVYAGQKGLFPGNYGRVIGGVKEGGGVRGWM